MMKSSKKHVLNSEKNTETKYPKGDKAFVGCYDGCLLEFSMISKTIVYDYGKICVDFVCSMAKTFDNKSQFVCDNSGGFKELDISKRKQVNSFPVKNAVCFVVTQDSKFLITSEDGFNCVLTKWSVRTKKQLHAWKSDVKKYVTLQSVSYDNKYQLIGYKGGLLGIFDLQIHKTLKNIQAMTEEINSVAFSSDNQSAFISHYNGDIKMLKWKAGANSGDDFDCTEELKLVERSSQSICLTKDEKYLLVASWKLLYIFVTKTRKVAREIKMAADVLEMSLIKDGKKAIIAQGDGSFSIIDLETLEISSIAENIAYDVTRIIVI